MRFSSTETYANRYDLDEIDVFLEGNFSNPMFFDVDGISKTFAFGKHYFTISILDSKNQQYQLRPNSRILFELKSINNIVLRSDVSEINQRNGLITCFFDVLRDPLRTRLEIEDGVGSLNIVASLENKENTENPIPEKFIGAMNYRCIFPINIRKNLINANSPIITNTEHKTQTLLGQYSFAKASISPLKTSKVGLTYTQKGNVGEGLPNQPIRTINQDKGGSTS
tara:strand:+ start:95 stop:769 length:675 start_codon:yes stop_codon:yes gene_type:complete